MVGVYISVNGGQQWTRASYNFTFVLAQGRPPALGPAPAPSIASTPVPSIAFAPLEGLQPGPEFCIISAAYQSNDTGIIVDLLLDGVGSRRP